MLRLFERLLAAALVGRRQEMKSLARYLREKGKAAQVRVAWVGEGPTFSA